ncbi:rCG50901 [Rattus norvegicus]|uniref:Microtubule-associated protein 10 n=1 Tax=Rattus norvegicus TaxID=10116 RepID=MAP10_RAT|nr:microtubule-associated protein 10 [Rattus norvegicus]D3ZAP3.1 RecName: Full=Microtubule-associated protein 10; AltName: Full=Microtubule regulator of 120 KDa [Rattus norvegicus]EDL96759.1 rCG50901 [Rattus norvegicus]|eukprot:NP_001264320.1 microtubule-associated protein 10 [Rattus norvegicus]
MAATAAERLFSLELLVDWVRLDSPCFASPAVAFRLLDFPPLLILPPAAPDPEPQRGAITFGRGKACLLRLRPAALRRPRLRAALLQLPAVPTPAPLLLGACDILLVPSVGQRGIFTLRGPEAERVGELALFYRLTDLGRFPPGAPQLRSPLSPACITGSEALEVSEPRTKETSKPCTKDTSARCLQCVSNGRFLEAPEPCAKDTDNWSAGDSDASAVQKSWEEAILHSKASSGDMASAPCSPAPSGRTVSPVSLEVTELDFETNTFCPPPLYYTHLTQEKAPSARVEITIEPQRNEPEDLEDAFPETKPVGPTIRPVKHTRAAIQESPPVLLNLPQMQGPGEANEAPCPPQTEQSTVGAIRQLPLLNALLMELSLLCNQPVANPSQVHPHLAWLYRGEHKGPDPSTKSTSRSESKSNKLSAQENEKLVSPQSTKNPKGKHSKISGSPPPKVTKGRLLYGLTNTLRLRLQQTNPGMLVVHEKREQYRRSQIRAVGPKFRIPSWKGKVSSLAAESQMPPQLPGDTLTDSNGKVSSWAVQSQLPPQLPRDRSLDSYGSFAEGSDTSMLISSGFDESSRTREAKQSHAMKKETVGQSENKTVTSLRAPVSPAVSVIPERSPRSNILRGKWKKQVQSPGLSRQDPAVDKAVGEGIDGKQVKAASAADTNENRPPSRKSSCESTSELQCWDGSTSPCYSEDFCTTENNSRSLPAPDSSTGAEYAQKGSWASKSSEARLSTRKNSSESSSVFTPPFSAGSPVCSQKRSRVLKTHDSLEEASSLSTSDFSSQWTNEKENQADPGSSKIRRRQDRSTKLKVGTGHKSSEKSHSARTSQVSSYEPSNLSELELKAIDDIDSASTGFQEEEDGLGSLRISRQCRDICELVINKLPGYTV